MIDIIKVRSRLLGYDRNLQKNVINSYRNITYWDTMSLDSVSKLEDYISNNQIDTIGKGEKIYFSKGAKISRSKFRQWAEDKDIKITYSPEKADIIVLNKPLLEEKLKIIKSLEYDYYIKNEVITNNLGEIHTEDICHIYDSEDENFVKEKQGSLPELHKFYRIKTYNFTKIELEDIDSICNIASSLSSKKYIDVNDVVNKIGGLTLNEDLVDLILNQLDGSRNDIDLAIEMMSNCRFVESEQYLAAISIKKNLGYYDYNGVSRAPLKDFLKSYPDNDNYKYRRYMDLGGSNLPTHFEVISYLQEKLKDDFDTSFWSNFIKELVPFKFEDIIFKFKNREPEKIEGEEEEVKETSDAFLTEF